ncbi:MAG: hypothetical protein IKN72_01760 [Clostridia bacterium]|nr:hypothetical protein [Clostridia bacterium]
MEFKGAGVLHVWKRSIQKLVDSNLIVPTERNGDTIELNNVVLIVTNPLSSLDEVCQFDKKRGIEYNRLERTNYWDSIDKRLKTFDSIGHLTINQISDITKKLTNNPFNRQAYATIWSPALDVYSPYPVCIVGVHFNVRNDKLNMTAIIRSNDAWGQALDDMYHLIKIQKDVAAELSIPVGVYSHFAMSYHIYLTDLIKAKLYLRS